MVKCTPTKHRKQAEENTTCVFCGKPMKLGVTVNYEFDTNPEDNSALKNYTDSVVAQWIEWKKSQNSTTQPTVFIFTSNY